MESIGPTERLYYHDATLLCFTARVAAHRLVQDKAAVVLDRTAFYPTSGGQPHDRGYLDDVAVADVVDDGEVVLHVLEGPLPPLGVDVNGRIDRDRREDHTQQHSAQHIVSQAFERVGGGATVGFHLGAEATTIDLNQAPLGLEAVRAAEDLANQIVLEDRAIRIHFAAHDDLDRFGLRKPTERTGLVRVVEIENFDWSACGGTHVTRTGQIGPIKVRRLERRGNLTRVEFLGGRRALRDYRQRWEVTRSLAERLSVKDADLFDAVGRIVDESSRLRDVVEAQEARLLEYEVASMLAGAALLPNGTARVVARGFAERSPDSLKRLALALTRQGSVIALLGSSGARRHLVFAQTPGLDQDMNRLLREVGPLVGARGGGSRDLAQGGNPTPGDVGGALEAAVGALRGP